jgi:putative mRNA 3-end processing factor
MSDDLIEATSQGLYCAAGDFYIDPWRPVEHAVITHAHADHARPGSRTYYTAPSGIPLLKKRLGADQAVQPLHYGRPYSFGDCTVSLHPAGHILGSAQVRVACGNAVWVASGDFKRGADPSCEPFELVPCDTFISEATFALPVYRWPEAHDVTAAIRDWWQANAAEGRASVLFTYALGKAQRILAELRAFTHQTVYLHGAVVPLTAIYRQAGRPMVPTAPVSMRDDSDGFGGELIIAPPSADTSGWMRRFRQPSTGFASGWMRIRGNRRRRGFDRSFVLSDHADWPDLLRTFAETGARRILTTHGRADELVAYLREQGYEAAPLTTPYSETGEAD